MSQSRLIPFTEMAKALATHGTTVTLVLTPQNAARFDNLMNQAKSSNLKIHFLSLPFPCKEVGLPDGCENMDVLPSPEYAPRFFAANDMLKEPLEKWLTDLKTLPSCIVSDFCVPWTAYIALKYKIPRIVFHANSCFTLLCSHCISINKIHEKVSSMTEPFVVPDLPDRIEFTKAQLPEAMKQGSQALTAAIEQFKAAEVSAQGILLNTIEELEPIYVKGYEKVVKNIWCIGPLSLSDKLISEKIEGNKSNNNKSSIDESLCLKFLNYQKPGSVIYVCFCSLCRLLSSQLKELALGLEASNYPFIWVIRKNNLSVEFQKWLSDERFEERIRGRGVVIREWAPQVQILSHSATGGFLTHCGWNSTLEGVSAGLPMITWPMFAEQFYNEKLIVQVLKIGVRIGVEVSMDAREAEKGKDVILVSKDDVKKAIEDIMERGKEGEERRNRARKLGDMAHKAVEEGGSSRLNWNSLFQHVMGQVNN